MKQAVLFLLFFIPLVAQAALPVGQVLSRVQLSGEAGGLLNGEKWDSDSLKGKIWFLFYVDPDQKDANDMAIQALGKLHWIPEVSTIAVINLAATWLPNSIISASLKKSQSEHPHTIYVTDTKKALVKHWGAGDNSYSISLIDADSKVLFSVDGTLTEKQIKELLEKLKTAVYALTGEHLPPSIQAPNNQP